MLPNADTSLFGKVDSLSVLLVPGLNKIHSIMQMLACLSHKIVHHLSLSQQLEIKIALVHIVRATG